MHTIRAQPEMDPDLQSVNDAECLAEYLRDRRRGLVNNIAAVPGGVKWARLYSDLIDGVVRRMLDLACSKSGKGASAESAPICIVATGGYGRRELCPHSDIDITFIPHRENDPLVDRIIKEMFTLVMRVFIDANNMSVGYAYRLLSDCGSLDHQTTCGLLDGRRIAGSDRLFIQLEHDFWSQLNPAEFIFTKLNERRQQRLKHGNTPRVVEPNLKDGAGGLRDLQTAIWVTQAMHSLPAARVRGDRAWEILSRDAGIAHSESEALASAKEFLFRVRNTLHALTGAERDQLVVTRQEDIAAALGYTLPSVKCSVLSIEETPTSPANPPLTTHHSPLTTHHSPLTTHHSPETTPPVERFMRDYYVHASNVDRITGDIIRRAENSRLFLGIGLDCYRREVVPANLALGMEDPVWMLWACELAQKYNLTLSDEIGRSTVELLARRPALTDAAQASEVFTRMLASPRGAYPTLQRMADIGILGWYLPEVGELMDLIPYDPSHDFTVGQHTLQVVRFLDSLRAAEGSDDLSELRRVMSELRNPEQLYLAALLHDAGKTESDRPHSETGEELAGEVCNRLLWDKAASGNVGFLVRHHLLMAETSRLRDLHLDETIREFVSIADDIDRLNMLYLLTYADTNAVGTGVWTQVKGRFLRDLYRRAEHALMSIEGEDSDDAGLTRTRRRLLKELSVENLPPDEIQEHVESMPAPYILNTNLNEIALHVGFVRRARQGDPVVDFFDERDSTFTEVTICTLDDPEPGLLSKIAGVFYAADIDVHSAQVFTRVTMRPVSEENIIGGNRAITRAKTSSGTRDSSPFTTHHSSLTSHHSPERIAIDTLFVDFRGRQLTAGKRKELGTNLAAVLKGEIPVTDVLAKRKKPAEIGGPVDSLKIRNDLSETFTIIEVSSADERAMLYRATGALSKLNLDIHSAKVSLFKGMSMGSFYVTGAKHRSEADLREALLGLMPLAK